jgi:hypothetical protein
LYRCFVIAFILVCSTANAEQFPNLIDGLSDNEMQAAQFKDENSKEKYIHHDFSSLFLPEYEFIGFIQPNYRKLEIVYKSVKKRLDKPDIYTVSGYSVVTKNRCEFTGEVVITQIREYKKMHFGVDDEYKDRGIKAQGIAIGKYTIKENSEQKYSGVFEGVMVLKWYQDKGGNIKADDIRRYSDFYSNNQYIGTWHSYKSNKMKVANWGEWRIPYSGDLDIGEAEFYANPKYYKSGWEGVNKY